MKVISEFADVFKEIKSIINRARYNSFRAINKEMLLAYFEIGKKIVEEEQRGQKRAGYGEGLIDTLSEGLMGEFKKGFDVTNLRRMRRFYLIYKKWETVSPKLTWSHYSELIKIEEDAKRGYFEVYAINENLSVRDLKRQIYSLHYERLLLSKDKKALLELEKKGNIPTKSEELIKDPYVLEFLGINEDAKYLEKDMEKALIEKLKDFLLELGKGFCLVARQKRITVDGDHYYIDLVFYNYILKCFFLIDLKADKLSHQDIGQMDFYVRYFEKEEKRKGDNPTIGLILCSDKSKVMAKYTLLSDSQNVFASKYKLYLPTEEELKRELERERWEREREMEYNVGVTQ